MRLSRSVLVLACLVAGSARAQRPGCGDRALDYAGRYAQGDSSVLLVRRDDARLIVRPIWWTSHQALWRVAGDSFVVRDRPERRLVFRRDARGCVDGVAYTSLNGTGVATRLGAASRAPVEWLLAGEVDAALRAYRALGKRGDTLAVRAGAALVERFPTRARIARRFLKALAQRGSAGPALHLALGRAAMAAGDREEARTQYGRALALDTASRAARVALRRFAAHGADDPPRWTLPFPLDAALAPPTIGERRALLREWRDARWDPGAIDTLARTRIQTAFVRGDALVLAHDVAGERHVGVVIVPDGALERADCCAVILDLKGTAPDFPPLRPEHEWLSAQALDTLAGRVVYVLPAFRGEAVEIGGATHRSSGDATDEWDGATRDALTFLRAALRAVPRADSTRVCALGQSRGGTVALLAAERDPLLRCVVAISAPTDWFAAMTSGAPGWTRREVLADALYAGAGPRDDGGQSLRTFLRPAIEGRWDLAATRRRLLASSPLYFAARLPATQLHYGLEDAVVPPTNGRLLVAAHARSGARPPIEAYFDADAGHDANRPRALAAARRLLARELRLAGGSR